MNPEDQAYARVAYLFMAAIAGAITSLSFMRWKEMGWLDRSMTLFVGASFALLFVPWAVADVFHVDISPLRTACAITYMGAVAANSVIPRITSRIKRAILDQEGVK